MISHDSGLRARLVVSLEPPHQVLMNDSGLESLLNYATDAIMGRSIKFMMGPLSDLAMLQAAIKNAGYSKSTSIHLALYSSDGCCTNLSVTCSPYHNAFGALVGCHILLEPSHAVSMNTALEYSPSAKVLVSAQAPYLIQAVNEEFTRVFGIGHSQAAGRSLRIIQGPRTDSSRWHALLETACSGFMAQGCISSCASNCIEFESDVCVFPVADQNSKIESLIIYFAARTPSRESGMALDSRAMPFSADVPFSADTFKREDHSGWENSRFSYHSVQSGVHWPRSLSESFADSMSMHAVVSPADSPQLTVGREAITPPLASLTIVPRRRSGSAPYPSGTPSAVSVTLDLLESLADQSITTAAARIRISA